MFRKALGKIGSLIQLGLMWLLRVYRYLISPLLGNRCRFYPSCSQYALLALEEYGVCKGIYLSLKRLLRCHPFHAGGYDPLPSQHRH